MELNQIYEKEGEKVEVNDLFIYCISVYKIWNNGASIIDEKRYSCNHSLSPSKNIIRRQDYIIQRFITLEKAPESYLINNQYKVIKNAEIN